jgi:glc operon protein GlcG
MRIAAIPPTGFPRRSPAPVVTTAAIAFTLAALVAPVFAGDPGLVEDKKVLTLTGAKAVAAAAAAEARRNQAGGAIAVVDDGGNLLYLERLDGTFTAASNIAIGKARSAANFRRDTRVFEDAIKNGRTSLLANPELLPLQGGVAILVDGKVVGGIGVAGANSAQQDEDIAKLAAASLASSTAVTQGSGR